MSGMRIKTYLGLFSAMDTYDHGLGFSVWPGIRIMLILRVIWCQGYESSHTWGYLVSGIRIKSYLGFFGARDIDDHDLGFSVWPGIRIMLILWVIWC